jgi:urease accessory protein
MPARGEAFDRGRVVSRFELFRGETPLAIESFDLGSSGNAPESGPSAQLLRGAFALRGQPVVANLYAAPAQGPIGAALVDQVRAAIGEPARGLCSVSSLQDLLVVRALGPNVEGVRESLIRAWQVLRPVIVEREPVIPRIWAT